MNPAAVVNAPNKILTRLISPDEVPVNVNTIPKIIISPPNAPIMSIGIGNFCFMSPRLLSGSTQLAATL